MKKLLLILMIAIGLLACKKSGVTVSASIFGKWELHRRYGGNILPADTTYKAGNGNIYQFNSDSTYKVYTNGSLTAQGVYHVRHDNAYNMGQTNYDVLYFNNDTSFTYFIRVSGSLLTLQPMIPDIGTQEYEKISAQ
jgi:hypothetical protein